MRRTALAIGSARRFHGEGGSDGTGRGEKTRNARTILLDKERRVRCHGHMPLITQ